VRSNKNEKSFDAHVPEFLHIVV